MRRLLPVLALIIALEPTAAEACGGLFCANAPPNVAPQPVDQNAERIIFEVDEAEGLITAHVDIMYVGDPDRFAWVVPVPSTPVVGESSLDLFQQLDQATGPSITLPRPVPCSFNFNGGPFCSVGAGILGCAADRAGAGLDGEDPTNSTGPVTIYGSGETPNYEYVVLSAENTDTLFDWLAFNDFFVSDNMRPVMNAYAMGGMKFLAIKLNKENRDGGSTPPITMTYVSEEPMIPLQLTAVAAQSYMGVLVFITGDSPYVPRNYDSVSVLRDFLLFDQNNRTNYFSWVAREVAENGGHRFITEFVGPNPVPTQLKGTTLSRYYTRMSPEHMDLDPVFRRHPDAEHVRSNAIDLTFKPPVQARDCDGGFGAQLVTLTDALPSPCAFNYCGPGAECAVIDGQVGCLCPEGQIAQTVTGPDGSPSVSCTPEKNPYAIPEGAGGEGTEFDPCKTYNCGLGECMLKGGFPMCKCNPETFACLESDNTIQCVSPPLDPGQFETFGPGAGPESSGVFDTAAIDERQTMEAPLAFGMLWPMLMALVGIAVLRRRMSNG